jgi:hypothetical protein
MARNNSTAAIVKKERFQGVPDLVDAGLMDLSVMAQFRIRFERARLQAAP